MGSSCCLNSFLILSALLLFTFNNHILTSNAAKSNNSFVFPIKKNIVNATSLYYSTKIQVGTPAATVTLLLDVGVQLLSFTCDDSGYDSSSYRFVHCNSKRCDPFFGGCLQCSSTRPWPHCSNQTCSVSFYEIGGLSEDVFKVQTADGSNMRILRNTPRLPFACLDSEFTIPTHRIPIGTKGSFGLGRNALSFVAQLSSAFNLPRKYAFCLPSSSGDVAPGKVFIGGGPYVLLPLKDDLSNSLVRTPLLINPIASLDELALPHTPSEEYFIGVKSIKIDKRVVQFDASLLSINATTGVGGTTVNSSAPYTILHSSIYKAVVSDFVKRAAARNITRVAAVKPFGACFSTNGVHWTRAGLRVPLIDLELEGNARSVNWRIYGANSMVRLEKNEMCLGFVDGGAEPRTSLVIGGTQLEDNLLEFDLTTSTLGFTSSLLVKDTSCSYSS